MSNNKLRSIVGKKGDFLVEAAMWLQPVLKRELQEKQKEVARLQALIGKCNELIGWDLNEAKRKQQPVDDDVPPDPPGLRLIDGGGKPEDAA